MQTLVAGTKQNKHAPNKAGRLKNLASLPVLSAYLCLVSLSALSTCLPCQPVWLISLSACLPCKPVCLVSLSALSPWLLRFAPATCTCSTRWFCMVSTNSTNKAKQGRWFVHQSVYLTICLWVWVILCWSLASVSSLLDKAGNASQWKTLWLITNIRKLPSYFV